MLHFRKVLLYKERFPESYAWVIWPEENSKGRKQIYASI
jgi:hypothetical protein